MHVLDTNRTPNKSTWIALPSQFRTCVQGMDIYSNILYVKEAFAALSHLAHRVATADKYRPETCCIIGNYYSLKGQHEKVPAAPPRLPAQMLTQQ